MTVASAVRNQQVMYSSLRVEKLTPKVREFATASNSGAARCVSAGIGFPLPMAHDPRVEARGVQEFHPGKPGGPAHRHQATHAGANPVVQLVSQFIGLVELHGGDFVLVFLPGVGVGHERFHDRRVRGERADDFQRQQGMLEMVQDAQAEDEVEHAQTGLGQLVEVQNPVV